MHAFFIFSATVCVRRSEGKPARLYLSGQTPERHKEDGSHAPLATRPTATVHCLETCVCVHGRFISSRHLANDCRAAIAWRDVFYPHSEPFSEDT